MTAETIAPPVVPAAPAAPSSRARTSTGASLLPLSMIIVGFFLPTLRGCERMESPAENFVHSPSISAIVYPYLLAMIVAPLIAAALARGPEPLRKALLVLTGLATLASVPTLVLGLMESKWLPLGLAGGLPAVGLAAWLWNRGRTRAGWAGWPPLLAALALASAISPAGGMIAGGIFDDAFDHTPNMPTQAGVGAYVYFAAVVLLAVIGFWGSRRKPADQSV